jgi:hypothetical protein
MPPQQFGFLSSYRLDSAIPCKEKNKWRDIEANWMRSGRGISTGVRVVFDVKLSAHTMNPTWAAARLRMSDVQTTTDTENARTTNMTNRVIVVVLKKTVADAVQDMIEEIFLRVIPHDLRPNAPDYVVETL